MNFSELRPWLHVKYNTDANVFTCNHDPTDSHTENMSNNSDNKTKCIVYNMYGPDNQTSNSTVSKLVLRTKVK